MANYHVVYDRERKQWKVLKAGGTNASAYFDTQKEAEARAKELSANQGGGEVRIHRKDNSQIRDSDTVGRENESDVKDTKY